MSDFNETINEWKSRGYDFYETISEWKNKGYIRHVKWRTANDSLVCSICKERAEKEFLLDEIENLLPAHEGCRCWITPIVDLDLFEEQIEKNLDEAFSKMSKRDIRKLRKLFSKDKKS